MPDSIPTASKGVIRMWPTFLFKKSSSAPTPSGDPVPLNSIVNFLARRSDADEGFIVSTQNLGTDRFEYHTFTPLLPGEVLRLKIVAGPNVLDVKAIVMTTSEHGATHNTGVIGFCELKPHQRDLLTNIMQRFRTCIA